MQLEGPPSEAHRNRSISDLACFQIVEYLSINNEKSGERGPKSEHEIDLCFIHIHTHTPRIILYHISNNSVDETKFHDLEFSM